MNSKTIIREVAAKYKIQPKDILGHDRFGHFVAARKEIMARLKELGKTTGQIGMIMNRDHSTVLYHTSPKIRSRRFERNKAKLAARPEVTE